jgi:phosphoserine aminotransferase
MLMKPPTRPANPNFSSGPCAKRPGWTVNALQSALVGRSHRSTEGASRLARAIAETKSLLELPAGFEVAIVPGSDTGAFELAMWNLLGPRGVDALAWESFGKLWLADLVGELKLPNSRTLEADFGQLPDLSIVDFNRDVLFTSNGTTAGVKLPNYDWVPANRAGLTLVDATSSLFAQPVDWSKVDCLTYSWQKVLGSEAAHGMLILSPRAIERLETHAPSWPIPKLFRLRKGGKLDRSIFTGQTINTPSMLCLEDYLDALAWARSCGGLKGLMARADANANALYNWADQSNWARVLATNTATRSNTQVCLRFSDPHVAALSPKAQAEFAKAMVANLETEGAGLDLGSYRDAPPGLRIWTGATVELVDINALIPWLDWAFATTKSAQRSAHVSTNVAE